MDDHKCAVCGKGIPRRPYQSKSVRACSPGCAKLLAVSEHPDIETRSSHWKHKLTDGGNHEE
jgi:hypothetical protein